MTYTDSQILDLIDDLHSVGQTEEPKEELKRLLKEWEIEVMRGFSADKYNPKVIVLENWIHEEEYTDYMKSIGYALDQTIEYNYIYVRDIFAV
jgi:hypothetical protein